MISIEAPSDSGTSRRAMKRFPSPEEPGAKRLKTGPAPAPGDSLLGAMYGAYVKTALENPDGVDVSALVALLRRFLLPASAADHVPEPQQALVLHMLAQNILALDLDRCSGVLRQVLEVRLARRDMLPAVAERYLQFLTVLCLGLPRWWPEVASKLVLEFTSSHTQAHHQVLQAVLQHTPTATAALQPLVARHFPHIATCDRSDAVHYILNCLMVCGYCPEVTYGVWGLVVENTIRLDVELQNELDEESEAEESEEEESEDEEEESESEYESDALDVSTHYTVTETSTLDLAATLDSIMVTLLEHTAPRFSLEALNDGPGIVLFNTLVLLFKLHILPTHATRLVQFLLFHAAQQQPELSDAFLVALIDTAFASAETPVRRIKALQYLALFVARALRLLRHQVVFVVLYLAEWLQRYLEEREREVEDGRGSMERFKLFYLTFQCLVYIFCFRHPLLRRTPDLPGDGAWECHLDRFFQRAVVSKFNPLRFCNETVVLIFARLAQQHDVAYCFTVIEHNKRERLLGICGGLDEQEMVFTARQDLLDLEGYFPFDPLQLRRAKRIVTGGWYLEWNEEDSDSEHSGDTSGDTSDEDDE